jgi:hypothetical protein
VRTWRRRGRSLPLVVVGLAILAAGCGGDDKTQHVQGAAFKSQEVSRCRASTGGGPGACACYLEKVVAAHPTDANYKAWRFRVDEREPTALRDVQRYSDECGVASPAAAPGRPAGPIAGYYSQLNAILTDYIHRARRLRGVKNLQAAQSLFEQTLAKVRALKAPAELSKLRGEVLASYARVQQLSDQQIASYQARDRAQLRRLARRLTREQRRLSRTLAAIRLRAQRER